MLCLFIVFTTIPPYGIHVNLLELLQGRAPLLFVCNIPLQLYPTVSPQLPILPQAGSAFFLCFSLSSILDDEGRPIAGEEYVVIEALPDRKRSQCDEALQVGNS